jgi:hypothetical protein
MQCQHTPFGSISARTWIYKYLVWRYDLADVGGMNESVDTFVSYRLPEFEETRVFCEILKGPSW